MTALTQQVTSIFEIQALIQQKQELTEQECIRERRYLIFAIQPNKGDAIPARMKNTITAKKLGPNLRHFMKAKGQFFDTVELKNVPDLAAEFQEYWLDKMRDDSELAQAIRSIDGYAAIHNYIAGEVLRERHKHGSVFDAGVAYALGLSAVARENRNNAHEAIQKGFRDAGIAMQENLRNQGIRLDSRQLGALNAILDLNIQKAVDRIEQGVLSHFDEMETRMNQLINDMGGVPAIEHKEARS